ncbi:Inosose dehydratase [Planctomycetes bacterium CA13]|uniref:Inosose dehydratase n=1 Tax=Novipirellula herctigrandis TaxID=2527986 RepID=A0A5C5Z597_9BACT|nr:Inosose dehydratase [Planctomycetes bacterium CA13]
MNHPNVHSSSVCLSRRNLVKASAIAGFAAMLARPLEAFAANAPYLDRIGLQLYTVRNQMSEDAEVTLSAIAKAGYQQVELMSIDEDAIKIAGIARDNGMMVHSAFMDWKAIADPTAKGVTSVDKSIELAERLGLRHIVFGYIGKQNRDTLEKCQRIADASNEAASKAHDAGMRMCYHNHSFEFAKFEGNDQTPYDVFMERFDPELMEFELDVFWVKIGGKDPLAMMNQLGKRISQVHLKDLKDGVGTINDEGKVPADAFKELGNGTIDMRQIVDLAKKIGVAECHVEQDQSPNPIESIRTSISHLQSL